VKSGDGESSLILEESIRPFSILTAVRGRQENLLRALPSWLGTSALEVIIIDYSSEPSIARVLEERDISDSRVRVVRVEERLRWHLSEAFNFGLQFVKSDVVLKLDADFILDENIELELGLAGNSFKTGTWTHPDRTQQYTNGAVLAKISHLLTIGGWDPRITTYGWEDSDLYERLEFLGLQRELFTPQAIYHREHSHDERSNLSIEFSDTQALLRASIQVNRLVAYSDHPWKRVSHGDVLEKHSACSTRLPWPALDPEDRALTSLRLLQETLVAGTRPLNKSIYSLAPPWMRRLASVRSILRGSHPLRLIAGNRGPSRIILRVEHGLGNRLRALSSGFALANRLQVPLVVCWIPDAHCQARLSDLFHWEGRVIEDEEHLKEELATGRFRLFDWSVVKPRWSESLLMATRGGVFIRSSKDFHWVAEDIRIANRFLQALNPVEDVMNLLGQISTDFSLGLHLRQIGGFQYEHLEHESVSNWGRDAQAKIQFERSKVRTEEFLQLVDYFDDVRGGSDKVPIFVSADNLEAKSAIILGLGERARFLESQPELRGVRSIQQALAELYALARADFLIGSTYSAFTEIAHRLALPSQGLHIVGREY